MRFGILTLDDFDVKGMTVICRVDINEPVDRKTGTLKDITRIKGCLPTIRELSDKGAKTVLLAHQGSDIEYKNYYTTEPHSKVISELLGRPVGFIDDVAGPAARQAVKDLGEGDILLLDNVRFAAEEMTLFETKLKLSEEEQSRTQVVKKLAPLADLYVCDAFAAAHRSQPTLVGFEQVLPSAMGRLFEEEFSVISGIMEDPARPCVFILGGAKIQDAFMMMSTVLKNGSADMVLTGGLVANIMLLAKGVDIGGPSTEHIYKNNLSEYIKDSQSILEEFGDKVVLPVDLAYAEDDGGEGGDGSNSGKGGNSGNGGEGGDGSNSGRREIGVDELPAGCLLADIGQKTADAYVDIINNAKTVFINGPMGIFEDARTEYGTKTIWEAVAASKAFSVIGGGDSITAVNKYRLEASISYICTGGGALVRFLTGEELPVVKALRYAASKFGTGQK